MKLTINGIAVIPLPGESLLDVIKKLQLDHVEFAKRPIAAKIAGEVFNMNYIPVREKDLSEDRVSIRRAMEASGGVIQLLTYEDPAGKDV